MSVKPIHPLLITDQFAVSSALLIRLLFISSFRQNSLLHFKENLYLIKTALQNNTWIHLIFKQMVFRAQETTKQSIAMCLILALTPWIAVSTIKHYLIFSLLVCLNSVSNATPELQSCLSSVIQNELISALGAPVPEDGWVSSPVYLSLLSPSGTGKWMISIGILPTDLPVKLWTKDYGLRTHGMQGSLNSFRRRITPSLPTYRWMVPWFIKRNGPHAAHNSWDFYPNITSSNI